MSTYSPEEALQALERRLEQIRCGNAHMVPEGVSRDLSMGKRQVWETRDMPARPWHWTPSEFARFLRDQRYPSNTLADRERGHLQSITSALTTGEYVPPEVMADPESKTAIDDAVMIARSDFQGERAAAQQKAASMDFDRLIARGDLLRTQAGEPLLFLHDLLAKACEAPAEPVDGGFAWLTHTAKRLQPEGADHDYLIGMQHAASAKPYTAGKTWLTIRDGRESPAYLYGEVHRLDLSAVESIMRDLLKAGRINWEQCTSVMGHTWQPWSHVHTSHDSSAPQEDSPVDDSSRERG